MCSACSCMSVHAVPPCVRARQTKQDPKWFHSSTLVTKAAPLQWRLQLISDNIPCVRHFETYPTMVASPECRGALTTIQVAAACFSMFHTQADIHLCMFSLSFPQLVSSFSCISILSLQSLSACLSPRVDGGGGCAGREYELLGRQVVFCLEDCCQHGEDG